MDKICDNEQCFKLSPKVKKTEQSKEGPLQKLEVGSGAMEQ